jgi:hypothetical protein
MAHQVQYGMVGLAPDTDGSLAAVWHEPGAFKWSRLDSTRTGQIDSPINSRFTMADIDGDGAQDLLVFSATVDIVWSFLEEAPSIDRLFEAVISDEGECGWLEITVGDFDGDGRQDLLAPSGYSCALLGGPELAVQSDHRLFETVIVSDDTERVGATFDAISITRSDDDALDAYFCNDFGPEVRPNQWAINRGDGRLEIDRSLGACPTTYCMSVSAGDLNSDGEIDLLVAGSAQQFAYIDTEVGFVDYWASFDIPMQTEQSEMPWGSAIIDLDNNGLSDILLTASNFSFIGTTGAPLRAWMQDEPSGFVERGEALGLPQHGATRGLVARDINADGIVDLLVGDYSRSPWLLLSNGCTTNNWLEIEAPAGTVVRVESGDQAWSGLVSNHQGFGGFGPVSVHIGLGTITEVDRVTAHVPWVGEVQLVDAFTVPRRIRWVPLD